MSEKIKILNILIDNISREQLIERLNHGVFVTPNVDHLIKLQKDEHFYSIYNECNWVVCDSNIIQLGLRFLGMPAKEVIPGSSLFPAFYQYYKDDDNVKIFLLGSAPGIARIAMSKINHKVNRQIVVGAHSPSFGFEKDEDECKKIVELINESGATVLVVGVGAPKQEKWIFKYKDKLSNINLFMPLGATIDFEAGNIKRAPKIFQKLALEWFYRMFTDPKRLIKRYLIDDVPFFYYIIKQKLGNYRNPFEDQL